MAANIEFLHPRLRTIFESFKVWYSKRYPGREVVCTWVSRTPVEQLELFCQGRLPNRPGPIITWKDGFVNKSRHNMVPSMAFDFGVKVNGSFDWSDRFGSDLASDVYLFLAEAKCPSDVRYGGSFKDNYHIELAS